MWNLTFIQFGAQHSGTNMASLRAELWRHITAQADCANRLDGQTLLIDGSDYSKTTWMSQYNWHWRQWLFFIVSINIINHLPLATFNSEGQMNISSRLRDDPSLTFASLLTGGLFGNSTSVAFNIVFSSKMAACDKLCPNGCHSTYIWQTYHCTETFNKEHKHIHSINFSV